MNWENLTSKGLRQAAADCGGVCLLPLGVLEKHGDHLPLGTDMHIARAVAERAAAIEPVVVFPHYFFGQILEARHWPGTVALKTATLCALLDEVCGEIARNGFGKILIASSHGGNTGFLSFFAMSMLERPRFYTLYTTDNILTLKPQQEEALRRRFGEELTFRSHAGLGETAMVMAIDPQQVNVDAQDPALNVSLDRDRALADAGVSSGFGFYSKFPYHYAGDHRAATAELGEALLDCKAQNLAEAVRAVKADEVLPALSAEFHHAANHP